MVNERIQSKRKLVRKLSKWLRMHFPCHLPVIIYLRDKKQLEQRMGFEVYGICDNIDDERILILMSDCQSESELVDTILHEWAHAVWYGQKRPSDEYHDDSWGRIYSRIYRKFHS